MTNDYTWRLRPLYLPSRKNGMPKPTYVLHWSQGSLSGQAGRQEAATGTCLVPPSASSPTSLVTIGAPPPSAVRACGTGGERGTTDGLAGIGSGEERGARWTPPRRSARCLLSRRVVQQYEMGCLLMHFRRIESSLTQVDTR